MPRSRLLLAVGLLGLVGLVLIPVYAAVGYTIGSAVAGARDDRSMPCGTWIVPPRCFGGATVRDFDSELTSQGYTCGVVHGVEHSADRCTGEAGHVDIDSNGSLVSRVVAWSEYGAPVQRSRTMFEIVAPDGGPVHSFSTLLNELATLTRNRLRLRDGTTSFDRLAEPTPLQQQALSLLGLQPAL
jgi:hypothetical protein